MASDMEGKEKALVDIHDLLAGRFLAMLKSGDKLTAPELAAVITFLKANGVTVNAMRLLGGSKEERGLKIVELTKAVERMENFPDDGPRRNPAAD